MYIFNWNLEEIKEVDCFPILGYLEGSGIRTSPGKTVEIRVK